MQNNLSEAARFLAPRIRDLEARSAYVSLMNAYIRDAQDSGVTLVCGLNARGSDLAAMTLYFVSGRPAVLTRYLNQCNKSTLLIGAHLADLYALERMGIAQEDSMRMFLAMPQFEFSEAELRTLIPEDNEYADDLFSLLDELTLSDEAEFAEIIDPDNVAFPYAPTYNLAELTPNPIRMPQSNMGFLDTLSQGFRSLFN